MPPELTLVPKPGLERRRVKILEARRPSDSLVELVLERPPGYDFKAGQFTYVFLPEGGVKRAYSIASSPREEPLMLSVKRVEGGPASNYLYDRKAGDELEISRALGSFTLRSPPDLPVVFLATGTGVAPFRAMIRELLDADDRRELWLFLGSRDLDNLPLRRDLELWASRHGHFRFVPVLSRAPLLWEGDRGWIQEAYLKRFFHPRPHHAYVCGLKRMVDDVRVLLLQRGLPPEAIHVERYD